MCQCIPKWNLKPAALNSIFQNYSVWNMFMWVTWISHNKTCTIFKTFFLGVIPSSQAASWHATCISPQHYFLVTAMILSLSFTQHKCLHFLVLNNTDTTEFYIIRVTTMFKKKLKENLVSDTPTKILFCWQCWVTGNQHYMESFGLL